MKSFCKEIGVECLSEEYKGVKEKLELICPQCGEIYYRNYDNLQQRRNPLCALCGRRNGSKKLALKYKDVKNYIEGSQGEGCKLISDKYNNVDEHLRVKCKCGNEFNVSFYKFRTCDKKHCNNCSPGLGGNSMGEVKVFKALSTHNVAFTEECTFDDLIGTGGRLLRYDFMVHSKDGDFIIEYDGKQHFEPMFGEATRFKTNKIHDKMKNEYAKKHEIPIYRIPYTQYGSIPRIIKTIIDEPDTNKYKI